MASFRVKGAACRRRELARVKRVFKLASIQPANERAAEGPGWVPNGLMHRNKFEEIHWRNLQCDRTSVV
jgi:hypothetical protein